MDLLLINFLSFHQELPHDILCTSRSDDNRRQPPLAVLMAYGQLLNDSEFPHDILCASRSDDNRRQPPLAVLMAYGQLLMDSELPHDILCISRSDDNRRADGGHFDLQQYIISYLLNIISNKADVCEAFCLFGVICGS